MYYGDSHFPTSAESNEYTEREEDARACVRRGIEWLDEHVPSWRDNVDPYCIQMWDSDRCVLAQATGESYGSAPHIYGLDSHTDSIKLGFSAPISWLDTGTEWGNHGYNELDEAWRELLLADPN